MEQKKILRYCENNHCIAIPVYYEFENIPAWRRVMTGSLEECEKSFSDFPDYLMATNEENNINRQDKRETLFFYLSIGKTKEAEAIKKQYHF